MLKGAPAYWWVWVEEYQCSCKFIIWRYGYTELRVFSAWQPVSTSWSSVHLSNTEPDCSTLQQKWKTDFKHPERGWLIHFSKLVFNNKVLAESELIPHHQKHVLKSPKSKKRFQLYLCTHFMSKPDIKLKPLQQIHPSKSSALKYNVGV